MHFNRTLPTLQEYIVHVQRGPNPDDSWEVGPPSTLVLHSPTLFHKRRKGFGNFVALHCAVQDQSQRSILSCADITTSVGNFKVCNCFVSCLKIVVQPYRIVATMKVTSPLPSLADQGVATHSSDIHGCLQDDE